MMVLLISSWWKPLKSDPPYLETSIPMAFELSRSLPNVNPGELIHVCYCPI